MVETSLLNGRLKSRVSCLKEDAAVGTLDEREFKTRSMVSDWLPDGDDDDDDDGYSPSVSRRRQPERPLEPCSSFPS